MPKHVLCSFASPDLKLSALRFKRQAEEMNIYDSIKIFGYQDLDNDFKKYVSELISRGKKKGYGYWVWQTFFHKKILSEINYDDLYHWCDIGCHLNVSGIFRLKEYFRIVKENDKGILAFQYKNPDFIEKFNGYKFPNYMEYEYTKSDLIKFFNLNFDSPIINSPQIWGGSFFIRKCKESMELLDEHFDITRNRFDLIDDDEEKFLERKHPNFIQHRHSQSVLSILIKKLNVDNLSAYECEWALDEKGNRTFSHIVNYPINAKRDKKKNFFLRFISRQKKNFLRLKNFFNN